MPTISEMFMEGAREVLGVADRLEQADVMETALQEAGADARLMARRIEDIDWRKMTMGGAYYELQQQARETQVERAHKFYFSDPIIKRTVDLVTFYTFANGIPKPTYRQNVDSSDEQEQLAHDLIDNFWMDEFNQATLTSPKAQYEKSLELQLQGNVFFLLHLNKAASRQRGSAPPLQITDLPQHEMIDVIPHPGNRKVPVWYERRFTPRAKNFVTDSYDIGVTEEVRYYRHWRHQAPENWNGRPWGPPRNKIGHGSVYHLSINKTSEMKFGLTALLSYLKWSAGLNEYMTSRQAVVMAIAQIALQARTRGGPRHVQQVKDQLADISRLAENIEGAATLNRIPNQLGRTKAVVGSEGVEVNPTVQDTGASGAATDISTMRSMVAAGSGIPDHHLGGQGSAGLAQTTSMDAPLQRMIEFFQQLWRGMAVDLQGFMLSSVGLDPDRLDQKMPPILARDFSMVASALAGVLAAVDPGVFNRELVRWYVGEVLDSMGNPNTQELLDKFFPEEWVPPGVRAEQMQIAFAKAQAGVEDPAEAQVAGAEEQAAAAEQAEQNGRGASYYSRGRTRSADERGPGDESGPKDAARAKLERTMEGVPLVEALTEQIEAVFEEAFQGDPELEQEVLTGA